MANIDMNGASYGQGFIVTDPRWTPTDVVDPVATADFAATQDIRTLDARLTALNGTYWSAFRLAAESLNDKIFWLRTNQYGAAGLA